MITESNYKIGLQAKLFRENLRNELIINPAYSEKPGAWEYKGKWYHSQFDLYVVILAHEAADQFGIKDVAGLIGILLGFPLIKTRGKLKGATKGTSIASKYISKKITLKSAIRLPMVTGYPKLIGGQGLRFAFTKVVGKFIGRSIPIIGWGLLAYDLGDIFYTTQLIFNKITNERK